MDAVHTRIFSRRTGLSHDRITALALADTPLDATRAVELGFADSIVLASEVQA